MPLKFNMLLEEVGISPADVRLLRHQPKVGARQTVDIWRSDKAVFDEWQSYQATAKRTSFARPYWAAFIGTWAGRTMFAGLYAVGAPETLTKERVDPISGDVDAPGTCDRFALEPVMAFEPYAGRLYIEWGGGPSGKRAWLQRADLQDKVISELHVDTVDQPFPGLMNIAMPLSAFGDAPPAWQQALQANNGVYLLTCPRDGSLYVGSATAAGGFWARWENYRANGHGGNVGLIGREPSDFIVSVLEVAGSKDNEDAILAAEAVWKRKLNSRDVGLNRN